MPCRSPTDVPPLPTAQAAPAAADATRAAMLAEIRGGLLAPRKTLPSKYFYDARGSALFERITELPEYYLTRAERTLLAHRMPLWAERLRARSVVELGAGSAAKTRLVLDALVAAETLDAYAPVDVSGEFLAGTAAALRREYPTLRVVPIVGDFTRRLDLPDAWPRPTLLVFLGSTIGNFPPSDAVALLRLAAAAMRAGDHFLLGADLRKDVAVLEAAYDDAQGVTAEFNRNILRVLNARLGSDFDPAAFRHRAIYDPREHRIEMHLVADGAQRVHVPGLGVVRLADGESIRTEVSYKYDRPTIQGLLDAAGLALRDWVTDADRTFALALAAG